MRLCKRGKSPLLLLYNISQKWCDKWKKMLFFYFLSKIDFLDACLYFLPANQNMYLITRHSQSKFVWCHTCVCKLHWPMRQLIILESNMSVPYIVPDILLNVYAFVNHRLVPENEVVLSSGLYRGKCNSCKKDVVFWSLPSPVSEITFNVNGTPYIVTNPDPDTSLNEWIRNQPGLQGIVPPVPHLIYLHID